MTTPNFKTLAVLIAQNFGANVSFVSELTKAGLVAEGAIVGLDLQIVTPITCDEDLDKDVVAEIEAETIETVLVAQLSDVRGVCLDSQGRVWSCAEFDMPHDCSGITKAVAHLTPEAAFAAWLSEIKHQAF